MGEMLIRPNGQLIGFNDTSPDLPIKIQYYDLHEKGPIFRSHWHDQFQILYFVCGEAFIFCNANPIHVKPGELVIINSREPHNGENLKSHLIYYLIKLDVTFLSSNQMDLCQRQYLAPLLSHRILFQNHILNDVELQRKVQNIMSEAQQRTPGFELAIKADIYHILVILMRQYTKKTLSLAEQYQQKHTMCLLSPVLEYMDNNYAENLNLKQLAAITNMGMHYFCRLFKRVTGKSPIRYINDLRINQAVHLLMDTELKISEISMSVGYNDSNYFCRLFKKRKSISPMQYRITYQPKK